MNRQDKRQETGRRVHPVVSYQVASGWRKPAGFPHARTFARAGDHITVGEIS